MVERQIVVLNVAGSSPVVHPISKILKFFAAYQIIRGVAQLVAHSLWERGVAGSNPVAPTMFVCARSSVG